MTCDPSGQEDLETWAGGTGNRIPNTAVSMGPLSLDQLIESSPKLY